MSNNDNHTTQPQGLQAQFSNWAAIELFTTEITPPKFPINALPEPVANFVGALAESTQTPPEMSGILALGVLSAAFQKFATVKITSDWSEQLCLYVCAVASPAERKSALMNALTSPLREFESYEVERNKAEIARSYNESELLEQHIAAARKIVIAATSPESSKRAHNELNALIDKQTNAERVYPLRLLVDDTTPEKLVEILEQQGGSLTLASAEGGVFDAMSGRYDKAINIDVYLKAHDGDYLSVDRIGRKTNVIKTPKLSMILTIQPDVLQGIIGNSTMRGRGLVARFLWILPRSKMGNRKCAPPCVSEVVSRAYTDFIIEALSIEKPVELTLSREAHIVRIAFMERIEHELDPEEDFFADFPDWGGKIVGTMCRIAALLHLGSNLGQLAITPMQPETVTSAIKIAECLIGHAKLAYAYGDGTDRNKDAKYLLKRILKTDIAELTKNEIIQVTRCKAFSGSPELRDEALDKLERRNYIRIDRTQTGSRPSETIFVNPAALQLLQ